MDAKTNDATRRDGRCDGDDRPRGAACVLRSAGFRSSATRSNDACERTTDEDDADRDRGYIDF